MARNIQPSRMREIYCIPARPPAVGSGKRKAGSPVRDPGVCGPPSPDAHSPMLNTPGCIILSVSTGRGWMQGMQIGEILIAAGEGTAEAVQEALRRRRAAGGQMGSAAGRERGGEEGG